MEISRQFSRLQWMLPLGWFLILQAGSSHCPFSYPSTKQVWPSSISDLHNLLFAFPTSVLGSLNYWTAVRSPVCLCHLVLSLWTLPIQLQRGGKRQANEHRWLLGRRGGHTESILSGELLCSADSNPLLSICSWWTSKHPGDTSRLGEILRFWK